MVADVHIKIAAFTGGWWLVAHSSTHRQNQSIRFDLILSDLDSAGARFSF